MSNDKQQNEGANGDIKLFGYFSDTDSKPTYDPGPDAICIYCRDKLKAPVRTISFIIPGDSKSYFYRVHRECSDKMDVAGESTHYEGLIIDSIAIKK